jgi:hypothetical protein
MGRSTTHGHRNNIEKLKEKKTWKQGRRWQGGGVAVIE